MSADPFRQSCDEIHISITGEFRQMPGCGSVRNWLCKSLDFTPTDELIPCCKQFGQDEQVALRPYHPLANAGKVPLYLPERRGILEKSDAQHA